MLKDSAVCATTEPKREDRVRSFFDHPENYLDRKRYDIRLRAETAQTFLRGRRCDNIIDIGCGDGSVSLPFLSHDRSLTLVDLSASMLSFARSNVPADLVANVKFCQDDFLNAALVDHSYDVAICLGVLAHVASPDAVIRGAANLLVPGGTLVLECTDSFHFMRRLMTLPGRLSRFGSVGYNLAQLSKADVLRMAKQAGLELEATFSYAWPPPGFQRIFSQDTLYSMVRRVFGDSQHNRNHWFGYEHILCFRRR